MDNNSLWRRSTATAMQQRILRPLPQRTGQLLAEGVYEPVQEDKLVGGDGTDALQVVGSVPITFAVFGVEAPNLGFVSVEDTGSVEFSLDLAKS